MENGHFDQERDGGFIITNPNIKYSYEYNLVSEDILIALDQNGPIKAQAKPPADLVFFRREYGEKFSKWITFIKVNGKVYSSFARPSTEKPLKTRISYLPERVKYYYEYDGLNVCTEVFVPKCGSDAIMTVEVENTCQTERDFEAFSQLFPLMSFANLAAWDRPDWYLRTSLHHDGEKNLTFYTRLMNPHGIPEKRRNTCFNVSGEDLVGAHFIMEDYVGAGDFYSPDAMYCTEWAYDFSKATRIGERTESNSLAGFQSVYAAKYVFTLKRGEKKTLTQVLSLLDNNGGEISPVSEVDGKKRYFDRGYRAQAVEEVKNEYLHLFGKNRIKTADAQFDRYVNAFIPLQMKWVSVLDRGWPTGMRGTRDASNDFMGLLPFNSLFSKKVLLHLFECERSDGWFPRQVGALKEGPHDMRPYVDGGVFVLEFLYEYISYTKDFAVLDETLGYLDGDLQETLLQHAIRALNYYACPENIGEDGLCKIRGGDWFDGINTAGLKGKGQSVTVSCQFVMAARYMEKVFKAAEKQVCLTEILSVADSVEQAVKEKAFNEKGFFNSLKNDDGVWAFSSLDQDGKSRMFAVPNAFAIFSGVATKEQSISVLKNFKNLKSSIGYKLFSPPFITPLEGVGRVARGDVAPGLLGNSTVYNHGAQGFLARACCVANDSQMAEDVLKWLLPYDQTRHPSEQTGAPPYAIVNTYQDVLPFKQRAGFSFLTGTVAMAVRIVYNYLFGITPTPFGLEISPCLTDGMDGAEVVYNYNGKKLYFSYKKTGALKATVDGKVINKTINFYGKEVPFIEERQITNNMKIEMEY